MVSFLLNSICCFTLFYLIYRCELLLQFFTVIEVLLYLVHSIVLVYTLNGICFMNYLLYMLKMIISLHLSVHSRVIADLTRLYVCSIHQPRNSLSYELFWWFPFQDFVGRLSWFGQSLTWKWKINSRNGFFIHENP